MAEDKLATLRTAADGHTPPVSSIYGFDLKVHKAIESKRVDRLHDVQMPAQWSTAPKVSTRTQLREERRAQMRPNASFDCDGDGFVGQHDYATAKKHDLGNAGELTGGQRDSAIAETCYRMGTRVSDAEIGGNARARRIFTSLREEPELGTSAVDTKRREQRLRAAEMQVASLKMKSSQQLKDCLAFPTPNAPVDDNGPTYTRTQLLERRRVERAAHEQTGREHFLQTYGYGDSPRS